MVNYSRLTRWLSVNSDYVNSDGSLKEEVKTRMLVRRTQADVDKFEAEFSSEYSQIKLLDETEPEPWPIYTAYDLFSDEDKKNFHPDGTMRKEHQDYLEGLGVRLSHIINLEERKRMEINSFNSLTESYAKRGVNWGASQMQERNNAGANAIRAQKQARQEIIDGEEISSLSVDVSVDEYWEGHNKAF